MKHAPPRRSPGHPARTYPRWIAISVEFGPGIRLVAASRSRKRSRESQPRRRTTSSSIMAMCAAGPPNPTTPSRKKRRATSATDPGAGRDGRENGGGAVGGMTPVFGGEYTRRGAGRHDAGGGFGIPHGLRAAAADGLSGLFLDWLDEEPLAGRALRAVGGVNAQSRVEALARCEGAGSPAREGDPRSERPAGADR